MRVIIVGGGVAGTELAHVLADDGHAVTLIDASPEVAKRGFTEHGITTFVGDGTEPRVLREADAGRADVVAAMLRRDADNLAVASIARSLGAARTIARLRDPGYRPIYAAAGVHKVFGEVETMVGALAVAIEHPRVNHSMVLGGGESIAFEIAIPANAAVAGMTLAQFGAAEGFPRGAIIAAITPAEGRAFVPRGDARIGGGESVVVVARREDVAAAIDFLTH